VSQAHLLSRAVRAVWVNGWAAIDLALPWCGMKFSGIGREQGWSEILANSEERPSRSCGSAGMAQDSARALRCICAGASALSVTAGAFDASAGRS
jgi:hypothetical protein